MRTVLVILAVALGFACAAQTSLTTWPYSSWNSKFGGGSMGEFKLARQGCLEQLGITDPESVAPDSSTENSFIECMNAANWCSQAYGCEKPGAS